MSKMLWEKVEVLDVIDTHDQDWLVTAQDIYGNVFEAVGIYSCGELQEVRDIEMVWRPGEDEKKAKYSE